MTQLFKAHFPRDRGLVRSLFKAYAADLAIDLGFQEFERELEQLPGSYDSPGGCVLIGGTPANSLGCVGLRPFDPSRCEMKRLFVLPQGRGTGLGRQLAQAVITEARQRRYRTMLLDTLPTMVRAMDLYRSLGFKPIPPYRYNPVPNTVFLGLSLLP